MKKLWLCLALLGLLTGCGAQESYETVADVPVQPVSAAMQQILLDLPEDVAAPVLETPEGGALYVCDGYSLSVQTWDAGDLDNTLRMATGFAKENLQIIQTRQGDAQRYESVWAAAGDPQLQVGRVCVLDDGSYHYVLTAMADSDLAGQLRDSWDVLFSSFRLTDADANINIGS